MSLGKPTQLGRSVTAIVVLALASLMLLGSVLSAIPMMVNHFTDYWNGFASLATVDLPLGQSDSDLGSPTSATYSGVLISSSEALVVPRIAQLAHTVLTLLVMIAGSFAAAVVAVRLIRMQPFARHLRWSLVALGLLVILLATVGPQLDALSVDAASQALGYPIYQEVSDGILTPTSPDSIMLNLWDPISLIGRFDIIMLLTGGLVAMFGFLAADGERIQRDTEGLI